MVRLVAARFFLKLLRYSNSLWANALPEQNANCYRIATHYDPNASLIAFATLLSSASNRCA